MTRESVGGFVGLLALAAISFSGAISAETPPGRGVYGAVMGGVVRVDDVRDSKEIGPNLQGALGYYFSDIVALELSAFGQTTQRLSDGLDDYTYGLGVGLNAGTPEGFGPFFLAGGGLMAQDIRGTEYSSPYAELGVGLYMPLPKSTALIRAELRYNLIFLDDAGPTSATPFPCAATVTNCNVDQLDDIRFNIGVQFGSGYDTGYLPVTKMDSIATAAAERVIAAQPPPVVPPDADNDGVPDEADQCPETPATVAVAKNGCVPDSDADGVDDGKDRCPGTPPAVTVDELGCEPKPPEPVKLDSDSDGVVDAADQCPGTALGTAVSANGCPLPVDSDGDGVVDASDQCANTPKEYQVDEVGCVVVETVVLESVSFASGGDKLSPAAQTSLKAIAASLIAYPSMVVEVGGHSDSQGPDAANLKLSQRRANSVRDYLISQGVPGNRLVAEGYGEFQPIADNKTADGRAKNRRVEFKVLKQ